MGYLFAAFFVLWAVTFGYLFILGGRQRHLSQQLASLRSRRAPAGDLTERAVPNEGQADR